MAVKDSSARIEAHDLTVRARAASSPRRRSRARASFQRIVGSAFARYGCVELRAWHAGDVGPELLRRIEIEALVQIHANTQTRLIDREESTQPRAEEAGSSLDRCSRSVTFPSRFAPSPAYSASPAARNASSDRAPMRSTPSAIALLDLGELGEVLRVRAARSRSGTTRQRPDPHVAHPERHRRLRHAEGLGDLEEGAAFGAQESGFLLFFDLAAVAHWATVPRRCDSYDSSR